MEYVDGVDDLLSGHDKIDDLEVVLETVPDEHAARVHQHAQLAVRRLERGEVLGAGVGVEVARLDARELGHVVHHLLLRGDVVVDERL